MTNIPLPNTQRAVQLEGPDRLRLNESKPVTRPGPHQVLARVEVVGLCFSDLKLLKQFSAHVRKSGIVSGLAPEILAEIPSYVPGDLPTVPGHETVVRIAAVGARVKRHRPGERHLVQTDYRWLPTANSNSAFGYNMEGALQEYVIMDERVITAPGGESTLIPVPEDLSASSIALVEPWACVEDSYAEPQRRTLKEGGRTLVVAPSDSAGMRAEGMFSRHGRPGRSRTIRPAELTETEDAAFDDVLCFGADPAAAEAVFAKLAPGGQAIFVLDGGRFGRPVSTAVGRVHYGGIRIVGTAGRDPAEALAAIPATPEIRAGDRVHIVGAAGPMGMMHVIRALSLGLPGVKVWGGDLSDERLAALRRLSAPLSDRTGTALTVYNPQRDPPAGPFDYAVVMAPVPALVAQAVASSAERGIINIFAGIPASVVAPLDLDTYIQRRLYFVGTSGSKIEDMRAVLTRVVGRQLDTDLSVAAVAGLDGAVEGIRAVEKNLLPGKILVYPSCRGLGLTPLPDLGRVCPAAAAALDDGRWNARSERALLAALGDAQR
jgi:threonine dehydrogenase-like Zn-dependent dehydrogenase